MANAHATGINGEVLAKKYLESKGYEILDENWRFQKSEIDLIALKDSIIVFAEVKTRKSNSFGEPEDFVDDRKQRLMTIAADEYIYIMDHNGEIRFDIISILFDKFDKHSIIHIEDAFWPGY